MASVGSSTTASGVNTSLGGVNRITGMVSGMDTDSMVKAATAQDQLKIDKLVQKNQLNQWKIDAYRTISTDLNTIKTTFLNLSNPTTNITSASTLNRYLATSSDSAVVSAKVIDYKQVTEGPVTIKVDTMATAQKAVTAALSTPLSSVSPITTDMMTAATDTKFKLVLDGTTKEITLGTYDNTWVADDFITDVQTRVNTAFGSNKIQVSKNADGAMEFNTQTGSSTVTILSGSSDDALTNLGFTNYTSNRINVNTTLGTIADNLASGLEFDTNNNLILKMGTQSYTFSTATTLSEMMSTINSDSESPATISYDELSDKITLTAKQVGAGENLNISSSAGTFFGLTKTAGTDAKIYVNGSATPVIRSSNAITVNGILFNISKASATEQTVTLSKDVDGIYTNIKTFFDAYNLLIDKVNKLVTTPYDRNFKPLTDDQRASMTEEQITKWETKAKTGILKDDSILKKLLLDMRRAFSDTISGTSGTVFSLGLSTGNYTENGKITVDETTLKNAIKNSPLQLTSLFAQTSTTQSTYSRVATASQSTARYNEEGVIHRLSDIINNNITVIPDAYGAKGSLVNKAGLSNDASQYSNLLYKDITSNNLNLTDLQKRLYARETSLYSKYANLETALQRLQNQANYMSSSK